MEDLLDDIFDDDLDNLPPVEGEEIIEYDDFFEDKSIKDIPKNNAVVDSLLESLGIKDGLVTIIGEDNKETKINFYELDKEDQLSILTPSNESPQLGKEETEVINFLKENKVTLSEYLEKYKEEILSDFSKGGDNYDVDSYSNDEIFVLDMKNKYDLSDEELSKELSLAKQDEELFNKKVTKIREEYKQLEDNYKLEKDREAQEDRQKEYDSFVDNMVNVALENSEILGFDLEDSDKNEVLTFLLDLDEQGTSQFYRDLNDPKKLYRAAWFLRYGEEAFKALKDAYEEEIEKLTDKTKKVVVKRDNNSNSIHDLF